jgi:hypothetical protein
MNSIVIIPIRIMNNKAPPNPAKNPPVSPAIIPPDKVLNINAIIPIMIPILNPIFSPLNRILR